MRQQTSNRIAPRHGALWLSWVLVAGALAYAGQPRLGVSHEVGDLGPMHRGSTHCHAFLLENRGTAPLKIELIRSLCLTCTTASVSSPSIAPEAQASLVLTYLANDKPGDVTSGVVVHTNDPKEPYKRLALNGRILAPGTSPRIETTPAWIDAGERAAGARATFSFRVRNTGSVPLRIDRVTGSPRCMPLGPGPGLVVPPAKEVVLRGLLDTSKATGALTEALRVHCNDPGNPVAVVPVRGLVKPTAQDRTTTGGAVTLEVLPPGPGKAGGAMTLRNGLGAKILIGARRNKPPDAAALTWLDPGSRAALKAPAVRPDGKGRGWIYVLVAMPPP